MGDSTVPYVHTYQDMLTAMPLLSRGANAAVFVTCGLLDIQPTGATADEIAKYTGLSSKTIKTTLATLLLNGLILMEYDRYRPAKFICYRKPQRETSDPTLPGKKVFPQKESFSTKGPIIIDTENLSSQEILPLKEKNQNINNNINPVTLAILSQAGIGGKVLKQLAVRVDPNDARDWFLWIHFFKGKPDDNPQGIAITMLLDNPEAQPPVSNKQLDKWWSEFNDHIRYRCKEREHQWWMQLEYGCKDCGIAPLDGNWGDEPSSD